MSHAGVDSQARGESGVSLSIRPFVWAGVGIAILIVGVFGDLLVAEGLRIPSHAQGDTARYFAYWRVFGYSEILQGNIPLWNPHVFSGAPYVGVFQTALFYPLNFIYLFMPVEKAVSVEFGSTLWLMAMFVFAWLAGRGLHPLAAFLAGVSVVFGATTLLRVLAGQMTVLETYAWWPLLLLAVDRLSARPTLGWTLVGIGATTMMILAGHPPTVMMAGAATAVYCIPALTSSRHKLAFVCCLCSVAVAPGFLSAIQLWEGMHTASEGIRQAGMSYEFATSHSFPPEQLLTLLAPGFFGNAEEFNLSYFGRVFYWDATLYIGLIALLLAVHGSFARRSTLRNVALAMTGLWVIAAMGGYTPFYRLLFDWVPGFNLFRAPSKFLFFAAVFASALIALGVDRLLSDASDGGQGKKAGERPPPEATVPSPLVRGPISRTLLVAVALLVLLLVLLLWSWVVPHTSAGSASLISLLSALPDSHVYEVVSDLDRWQPMLVRSLSIAVATCAAGVLLLFGASRSRIGVWLVVAAAVIELFVFARANRGSTWLTIDLAMRKSVIEALQRAGSESRVLQTAAPSNIAVGKRRFAVWGYDPVVLGRYAKFMAFTQGAGFTNIRHATHLQPTEYHPLLSMLRLKYRVIWETDEIIEYPDPLPPFLLVEDYRVVRREAAVFRALSQPGFDARKTVLLESEPKPAPRHGSHAPGGLDGRMDGASSGGSDRLWLLDQSTDHFEIEADLSEAKILLITDTYSDGWRAVALDGSSQSEYQLLPANYVLRAIPMAAGHHRLRVEYSPIAFRAGAWASMISGGLFVLLTIGLWIRRFVSGAERG